QRTAMPPSGPRNRSGSRPEPPGSTSVSGPGQNARANASADALNASPCASAIARSLINKRKGLRAERPFSAASAATSACSARDPRPYIVSVGYASKPPFPRCLTPLGIAVAISESDLIGTVLTDAHVQEPRRFGRRRE